MQSSQIIANYLKTYKINYEAFAHKPFFTVEETLGQYAKMGIPENKSLFLRDEKKRRFFLVVIEGTKSADLKALAARFGERRVSFASEKYLADQLHTYPGAVSPLGLVFAEAKDIEVLIDQDLLENEYGYLGFHPNENTATWKMSNSDFITFIHSLSQKITTTKL